jgi:hypothetical protein
MTIRTHLETAFAEQFGLPQISPPVLRNLNSVDALIKIGVASMPNGLSVTEYRMDGIMLGNADIAINNRESVEGICVEDEDG